MAIPLDQSRLPASGYFLLELSFVPFVHEPLLPAQRLKLYIEGKSVGTAVARGPNALGFVVGREALLSRNGTISLQFDHLDATRPADLKLGNDTRQLAIAYKRIRILAIGDRPLKTEDDVPPLSMQVLEPTSPGEIVDYDTPPFMDRRIRARTQEATGLLLTELVSRFENLGDNCEFGLFQRHCGAEPLGLFRFARTPADSLVHGLASSFPDVGDVEKITPYLEGQGRREYMIREESTGIVYHTNQFEEETTAEELASKQAKVLNFLRRKILEESSIGAKIFVRKTASPGTSRRDLTALLRAAAAAWQSSPLGDNCRRFASGWERRAHCARAHEGLRAQVCEHGLGDRHLLRFLGNGLCQCPAMRSGTRRRELERWCRQRRKCGDADAYSRGLALC